MAKMMHFAFPKYVFSAELICKYKWNSSNISNPLES